MTILFLSTMYPNSIIYMSGVFVHEQVKSLKKLGVNIEVVAPIPLTFFPLTKIRNKWKLYDSVPIKELIEGVKVYHPRYLSLPRGILKDFWGFIMAFSILKVLKKEKELGKIDIIHAHGGLPDDHTAKILAQKLKLPYVVTVHGDTVYSTINKRYFYRSKEALENANAIIAVSTKVEERIKKYVGLIGNIFCVLNGYNFTARNKKKKVDGITILFAANLIERKGCSYLLYAYSALIKEYHHIHLVIAGGGEQLNTMKKLAQELNVLHKVTFTGTLKHLMILELMADSDIFILPSTNEAFGVVYLEAMSFKKPVIGTEGEGITDIIQDGVNGFLVKPKSIHSIVNKLKLLIESSELRKEIGEKGFDSIKNLTWENNAKETMKIYEKIIRNRKNN